ncbi:MAG: trypsin-like peptidase domain-containing protein [Verrucomicrobiota bacterium]
MSRARRHKALFAGGAAIHATETSLLPQSGDKSPQSKGLKFSRFLSIIPAVAGLGLTTLLAADGLPPPPNTEISRPSAGTAAATLFPTAATPPALPAPTGTEAPLIARITPAVVSVFPAKVVEEAGEESPLDQYFGRDRSGPGGSEKKNPQERDNQRIQGNGSGVILSADGWIVTNNHVVHFQNGKLADAVSVELSDHRRFDAKIAGYDPLTDLALLKIAATGLSFLPLADSDALAVGDTVIAIGNPFKVGITATRGMISALRRANLEINGPNGYESFIQTDAAINPGNSGGALVNLHGQLAGINSAIWSGSGRGNIGIGFAIPSNLVRSVICQLAENGKVQRGFFGVQTAEVGLRDAAAAGLEAIAGARISEVVEGGPVSKAGLKPGDIVLEAGGRPIETRGDLRLIFSMTPPDGTLVLTYQRQGKKERATVTAAASPEAGGVAKTAKFQLSLLPGVDLTRSESGDGLTIAAIPPAAAGKTGLSEGAVILAINGTPVHNEEEAEGAAKTGVNSFTIKEGGDTETLAVRLPPP